MKTEKYILNWKNKVQRMQIMENIFKSIINIIIILVVIINVVLIAKTMIASNETPSIFGIKTFIVVSGSMQPEIGIGDMIFVKTGETIKLNDIISYKLGDMIVTHRVKDIIEENGTINYRTKGDYNNSEDAELVDKKNVEGIVIFKIGKIGQLLIFLKTKLGIFVLAITSIILYKFGKIVETRKNKRKNKRKLYDLEMQKKELEINL